MKVLNGDLKPMFSLYCVDYAPRFGEHSDDVMREYARQLIANNIGRVGLKRGIERLVNRAANNKFTPNPAEFAQMCKPLPEDLGLPSIEDAYAGLDQACRQASRSPRPYQYKHRMIELIAKDIRHSFHLATEEKRQTMLRKSYGKWLEIARNEGLPEPVERINRHADPRPTCSSFNGAIPGGSMGAQMRRIQANLAEQNKNKARGRAVNG